VTDPKALAAIAYSLWDCQHTDKLTDNPSQMERVFAEAQSFADWLERFGYGVFLIQIKREPEPQHGERLGLQRSAIVAGLRLLRLRVRVLIATRLRLVRVRRHGSLRGGASRTLKR
jgi:hypothetical protein